MEKEKVKLLNPPLDIGKKLNFLRSRQDGPFVVLGHKYQVQYWVDIVYFKEIGLEMYPF